MWLQAIKMLMFLYVAVRH